MRPEKKAASNVNPGRRRALKKLAAGGAVVGILGLSGKWSKPVVDSIVLPAHAQATYASIFTVYTGDKKKKIEQTTTVNPANQ